MHPSHTLYRFRRDAHLAYRSPIAVLFHLLDQKIDQGVAMLRRDMSTDFRWLVGIMLATMASLAGTAIGVALSR